MSGFLIAVVLLAGCSRDKDAGVASTTEPTQAPTTAAAAGSTRDTEKAADDKRAVGAKATTTVPPGAAPDKATAAQAGADNAEFLKRTFPITATLSSDCVRPGSAQTITIRAVPGAGLAYNTYYADGKSGLDQGYYGGNNGGHADDDGTWTDTWTIAANAPAGPAHVALLGTHPDQGHGEASVDFNVSDPLGNCK